MHEDGLPRLHPATLDESEVARQVVHRHRGPGLERDSIGQREDERRGHAHLLGETAIPGERRHAVTGGETRPLRRADDGAGDLGARDEGQRRLQLIEATGE